MSSNELATSLLLTCSQPLSPWLQEIIRTKLSELDLSDHSGNEQGEGSVSELGLTSQPLPTPKLDDSTPAWVLSQQPSGPTPAPPKQAEEKPAPASSCQLAEIGEFLVRLMTLTSRIASALVEADDIKAYIDAHVQQLDKMHQLSDMDVVRYMSKKESYLNKLAAKLEGMANETALVWKESPNPPYPLGDLPQAVSTALVSQRASSNAPDLSGVNPNCTMRSSFASMSPAVSWNSEQSSAIEGPLSTPALTSVEGIQDIYPGLGRRGVGNYKCPFGKDCTKGGVRDGELVKFERNSSFKAHLQKHAKAYKCNIPLCKNSAGFARIDQLKRHKIEVHHMKPEDVEQLK
ncbi:hypothetical protein FQN49_004826 [Arthroderma sp. PD_2]|nr:hypothetical protein FQN49_004826 [Arthroderma sp. PD_2]